MPSCSWRRGALLALLGVLLCAPSAHAQATRTWISGVGDDVNPCSRTAPCKTIAGAISKTADAGEINAIDPGGFGAVTVTKAITIDLSNVKGGILNTSVSGVTVNAPATADVVLRGLSIDGAGAATGCGHGGVFGVRVLGARTVRIEDTTIARQNVGVSIEPTGTSPQVVLDGVTIRNVCAQAVNVAPAAGRTATVMVDDASISGAATGVRAAAGATVWVTGSTIFATGTGLLPDGGVINSSWTNDIHGNGTDGTPTTVYGAPADGRSITGPAGPAGPAGAPGPAGPPGAPATKLMVDVAAPRLSARAGRAVTLRYVATAAGRSVLRVRRGTRTVATVRGTVKAGRNAIRWNGKVRGRLAAAGRYALALAVTGADGQRDAATATVRLRR